MKKYAKIIIVFSALVAGYFLFQNGFIYQAESLLPRKFPALSEPKNITLACNFKGTKLMITETLYGSVNEYYKKDPKKKFYFYRDDNKAFVYNNEEDKTLDNLTEKIQELAEARNLNNDQTLDLAACFMQNIPYDEVKAKKILDPNFSQYTLAEIIPRYPYETLYDNAGICTDKSYLGAAVLSRLGYGTSLLSFEEERHLSLGVSVPDGYAQYGDEYAIMELTGKGFLVGDLPMIKQSIGLAENTIDNIPQISKDTIDTANDSRAITKTSKIEVVNSGQTYSRIAERAELRTNMMVLKAELESKQEQIILAQQDLKQAESEVQNSEKYYKDYPSRENYNTYTSIYRDYQVTYAKANQAIAAYNALVTRFNAVVQEYKSY